MQCADADIADQVVGEWEDGCQFVALAIDSNTQKTRIWQMIDECLHVLRTSLFAQLGENFHSRGLFGVPSMNVATELAMRSLRSVWYAIARTNATLLVIR